MHDKNKKMSEFSWDEHHAAESVVRDLLRNFWYEMGFTNAVIEEVIKKVVNNWEGLNHHPKIVKKYLNQFIKEEEREAVLMIIALTEPDYERAERHSTNAKLLKEAKKRISKK